jgi:phospholipid N-methyltransferase
VKVPTSVLEVLDRAETDGPRFVLTGTLDRKLYTATAKVLEAAGGKWSRSAKAHLFDGDAADAIEQVLLTGEIVSTKQQFGYFPTPHAIVEQLIELADVTAGLRVLEPSAGRGAIVGPLLARGAEVVGYEYQAANVGHFHNAFADVAPDRWRMNVADFLAVEPSPEYDRVVMNPPFAKQDDIRHVLHAWKFLKVGGRLVAVMSNGVTFRSTPLTGQFFALKESQYGELHPLPEGSFKESGTGVNTVIAVIPRAA